MFVTKDVCEILELGNPTETLNRLDDDERTLISIEGASNGLPVNAVLPSTTSGRIWTKTERRRSIWKMRLGDWGLSKRREIMSDGKELSFSYPSSDSPQVEKDPNSSPKTSFTVLP